MLEGHEGKEKKMESTIFCYRGATIGISSFILYYQPASRAVGGCLYRYEGLGYREWVLEPRRATTPVKELGMMGILHDPCNTAQK